MNETQREFNIPVYPHVKKFILKRYRFKKKVVVTEHSSLGKLVTLALRESRSGKFGHGLINEMMVRPQTSEKITETLTLVLTKEQSELSVRLSKLARLNIDFDVLFKEHMLTWIEAAQNLGFAAYPACRLFLQAYGIEESEYSLESAYRYYQRSKDPTGFVVNQPN
jgi:hypothetical protein